MFKKNERIIVSDKGLPDSWAHIINNYKIYFVRNLPAFCGNFVEVLMEVEGESGVLRTFPRKNCFHMVDKSLPLDKRMEIFKQDYIIDN